MPQPPKRTVSAPRRARPPVLLLHLEPGSDVAMHRQVYDALRDAILSCRLAPGARLPSSRALATELGVSRTTITVAYEQLRSEGYISGQRGGGSRVECTLPDAVLQVPASRRVREPRPAPIADAITDPPIVLSRRGALLARAGARLLGNAGTPPVAFRLGMPATDVFPTALWSRLTARRWRHSAIELGDGHPAGDPVLRDAIAGYLTNARGARCTKEHIIIVSGTQQALDLAARVLLDPGDAVWVENPGYGGAQAVFAASGADVIPVPVDDDGLDVAAGERMAPSARMAYVTPSHQFPLGAVMSASRRLALLAWARRAGSWILEDDYDSEFRYAGRPLPCLQGLDAENRPDGAPARVLYIGTFNKILASGLRFGYLVVPDVLIDPMRAARASMDRHPPTPLQGVLTDFIVEGHFARHIRRLRALYAERQAVLLRVAASELGDRLTLAPDCAGLHLVGALRSDADDVEIARRALRDGVETTPLSTFFARPANLLTRRGLLLSYAGFSERAITDGVRRLAQSLRRD